MARDGILLFCVIKQKEFKIMLQMKGLVFDAFYRNQQYF